MREFRLLKADIAELRELFLPHHREDRLLSARQVSERTTLSPAEIRRRELAGTFPRGVAIGPKRKAWPQSEINRWIRFMIDGRAWLQ